MFINITNHPHTMWGEEQLAAARCYGEIVDIPFPEIDPEANESEIESLAQQVVDSLPQNKPITVHIMGEMTFTFAIVSLLKAKGLECLASTTKREVVLNPDGSKTVFFKFVQFRHY